MTHSSMCEYPRATFGCDSFDKPQPRNLRGFRIIGEKEPKHDQ